jgi:hypothetical protein
VFGYGLKYLFGTAEAMDVKRLNDVCDNLTVISENSDSYNRATNDLLTYIG